MTRDKCNYTLTLTVDSSQKIFTGVTVGAGTTNTCGAPIPVTIPGKLKDNKGLVVEQLDSQDLMTVWVPLTGSTVSLTFSTPISW